MFVPAHLEYALLDCAPVWILLLPFFHVSCSIVLIDSFNCYSLSLMHGCVCAFHL